MTEYGTGTTKMKAANWTAERIEQYAASYALRKSITNGLIDVGIISDTDPQYDITVEHGVVTIKVNHDNEINMTADEHVATTTDELEAARVENAVRRGDGVFAWAPGSEGANKDGWAFVPRKVHQDAVNTNV